MIIILNGIVPSGKNNLIITRSGQRVPRKKFVEWRDNCLWQIKSQLGQVQAIDKPISITVDYWPGDKRRRDVPGIIDSIWHVLEKSNVVTDDVLLGGTGQFVKFKNCGISKEPKVMITL